MLKEFFSVSKFRYFSLYSYPFKLGPRLFPINLQEKIPRIAGGIHRELG